MIAYEKADRITLVHSGEEYFEQLRQLIEGARKILYLQTYIYQWDDTGKEVLKWLSDAVERGVSVFLLVDAFGSPLPKVAVKAIRKAGVQFRVFAPWFSSEHMGYGRRLHHKITVADERMALIGGINVADRYRGTAKELAWLDYAVLIEGKPCLHPYNVCQRIFDKKGYFKAKPVSIGDPALERHVRSVRFCQNDWLRRKNEIYRGYCDAIRGAEKSIIIAGSYFLPGQKIRRELARAAQRGVKIRILLSGKSDVPMTRAAESHVHLFLLSHGMRVFEWHKSILHAKAMIVDERWATVGSFNINQLSRLRGIEYNAEIADRAFAHGFATELTEIMDHDCQEITEANAPVFNRWLYRWASWLAFQFFRWLVIVFITRKGVDR